MKENNKSFTDYYISKDKEKKITDVKEQLRQEATIESDIVKEAQVICIAEEQKEQKEKKQAIEDKNKLTESIQNIGKTLVTSNQQLIESLERLNNDNVKQQHSMIAILEKLVDRIEMLEEKLNIEIPTPVVNIQLPRTTKKVHRDGKGHISHITEEFSEE